MPRSAPLALLAALASVAAGAAAAAPPEILAVEPGRRAGTLTCTVRSSGLPGERIASSLESGLPSAIEMDLDVFDERDRVVTGRRVLWRLAFDLWEEVFRVEGPGGLRRFSDRAALERFLARLSDLPVSPLEVLRPERRHRIRVGLRLHPVAPREAERLSEWVAGGNPPAGDPAAQDPDGREVSVNLGELIRFFYRGARREERRAAERFSGWFLPGELPERGGSRGAD